MIRSVLIALAVTLGLMPASASADSFRATDARAGVTFALSGNKLTVSLAKKAPANTVRKVNGKRLSFACGTGAFEVKAQKAASWKKNARKITVTLPNKVRSPRWCGVETVSGGDIAFGFRA